MAVSLTSVSQIKLTTQTKPLTRCLAHSGHSWNICRLYKWTWWFPSVSLSLSVVSDSLQLNGLHVAHQAPLSMKFSRQEYWSWVAIPLSRGSSWPRGQTQVSCIAGRFFIVWATREALMVLLRQHNKYLSIPCAKMKQVVCTQDDLTVCMAVDSYFWILTTPV